MNTTEPRRPSPERSHASSVAAELSSLPALDLLPTPHERERACIIVAEKLGPRWVFVVLQWTLGLVSALCVLVGLHLLRRMFDPSPAWSNAVSVSAPLACMFLAPWVFARLHRKRAERLLWNYLVQRGIPICARCGYDLRGQSIARCPECGRRFDPGLLRADPAVFVAGDPALTERLQTLLWEYRQLPPETAATAAPYVEAIAEGAKANRPNPAFLQSKQEELVDAANTRAEITPALLKAADAVVNWACRGG